MQGYPNGEYQGWLEYILYGGMPKLLEMKNEVDKTSYLNSVISQTYIKDILEHNDIRNSAELEELLDFVASSIGGLINPKKLADTFKSVKNVSIHPETIKNYLDYFEDSFLISKAKRYDVKGKKYINTPMKYYFQDVGLRNARLHFRQIEESNIMENVIYNELLIRGFKVDVGSVDCSEYIDSKQVQKQLEVDFVCNLGSKRIYVQSALSISEQEQKSLIFIRDSFKKVIIAKDAPTHYTEKGILILNLFDFLLDFDSLNK